ncbi:MAG TPA: glycosyltransferase, partial [Tepidisphaeraceae bacterium]|nr:glycosyltransferase [Tepidisphaeraceae bacterium]
NDFLAFTDDDCAAHQNWLMQLAAALTSDRTTLIGGQRRNAMPENFCCTASQMIIDVVNVHFNHDHQNATFFPSDNMAMSRQQFLEIGGFDTTFRCSEDRDLCDRWSARGWRLVFTPDAVVDHARKMGLWGFCKQHFGYGRGAWRFHKTRKMRGRGNVQVEGSFYLKCFREPFRTEPLRRAILLAMLLVIWQLVNTAGFFFEAFKSPGSAQTSDFKSASTIR